MRRGRSTDRRAETRIWKEAEEGRWIEEEKRQERDGEDWRRRFFGGKEGRGVRQVEQNEVAIPGTSAWSQGRKLK